MSSKRAAAGMNARICTALLTFAHVSLAVAQTDVVQLLEAMRTATRTLNYSGTFVYQRGADIESMQLIHRGEAAGEAERLLALTGPIREIVRHGSRVTCRMHAAAGTRADAPTRDAVGVGLAAPVTAIAKSYRVLRGAGDRVAGRAVTAVQIEPLSADRYSYRLWLDDESKLLLKSVIVGANNQPLEQMQFTHFELLEAVPPALLEPTVSGDEFSWETSAAQTPTTAPVNGWAIGWLPRGFEFKESNVQTMATSATPVDHLVYSDGLAMVSIFIEGLRDANEALRGHTSHGAVNAFSRVMQQHQVTVVGEVPLATVRRIADAVARAQ